MADNYFGHFGELCHARGLKFSTEPYGNGGFDNLQSGRGADIPMGEFWVGGAAMETVKVAASVGHVYGRPVIGAESFTADEARAAGPKEPYALKAHGRPRLLRGGQPLHLPPLRHAALAGPQARHDDGPLGHRTSSARRPVGPRQRVAALRRAVPIPVAAGPFVADVLYFSGENAPNVAARAGDPTLPAGYDYDGVRARRFYAR